MISAKFTGLAGLASTLNTFRKAVKVAATTRSKEIADELVDDMKTRAPEDSGALIESIRAEPGADGSFVVIAGGTPETTLTTSDGRTFDEARVIEFGRVGGQPQPFFRPALETARRKYGDQVLEVDSGDSE